MRAAFSFVDFTVIECQRRNEQGITRPAHFLASNTCCQWEEKKGELPFQDPGSRVNDFTQRIEFIPICMVSWCKILVFTSNMKYLCYKECKEMTLSPVKCRISFI